MGMSGRSPKPAQPDAASRSRRRDPSPSAAAAAKGREACSGPEAHCGRRRHRHMTRGTATGASVMKRTASAAWSGDLKQGKGTVSTQSGVLKDTAYSFSTRFESGTGTNPEELIAAAHAGCYSMALSAFLGQAGFTPKNISPQATLTFDQVAGNWTVT